MVLPDWIYEWMPKSWQQKVYDWAINDVAERIDNGMPARETGARWYGDAEATVHQAIDADIALQEQKEAEWAEQAEDYYYPVEAKQNSMSKADQTEAVDNILGGRLASSKEIEGLITREAERGDDRDYAALTQEYLARRQERDEIEAELDEDEYDRAGRDDEEEELGF